ncbi:F0F1 ATP synthase subunit A [Geochorda subterranea]|uniref:ATP synthase subunit a n=1 Tax=Geochorda subterranea TaxID=3109564 RepID=A0ABZ1BPU1_9FIRM|nr:F0F1 ATP synthase subunit A [Limnochorda sp. LNt]WRP14829.1 F0F1 ATP synthase subunit A [Limnochorda sp. LNt]
MLERFLESKLAAIGHVLEEVAPRTLWQVGPFEITTTVVNSWAVVAIIAVVAVLLRRQIQQRPRGLQTLAEVFYRFIEGLLEQSLGHADRRFVPLVGTFFVMVLALNYAWFIPGVVPPTTDLSTTVALAATDILLVQVFAARAVGLRRYLKRFVEPIPFLLPMNVLEELVKVFSLSVRLFGNLFGGDMVVAALFVLVPFLAPTPVMLLEVLFGFIQALIFATLTSVYVATAMGHH